MNDTTSRSQMGNVLSGEQKVKGGQCDKWVPHSTKKINLKLEEPFSAAEFARIWIKKVLHQTNVYCCDSMVTIEKFKEVKFELLPRKIEIP